MLPLSGQIELSVVLSDSRVYRTMDLLEHAIRTSEHIVGVPFPRSYAIVLVADVSAARGRGGSDALVLIDPGLENDLHLVSHELAHTYWHLDPNWIKEGASDFLSAFAESALTGEPLRDAEDSCSLADNIANLVRQEHELDSEEIYRSACNYILGRGMFLELYRELGESASDEDSESSTG